MNEKNLIDETFYVQKSAWGTWKSYDKNRDPLITSFTQESCINSTREYCKWIQDKR